MKKHTKCRMNEICRKPHRDGECERNCYYNTIEVKTKADALRAMSDEEIENWFWWMHKEMMRYTDSRVFLHDWLRQEVSDGRN